MNKSTTQIMAFSVILLFSLYACNSNVQKVQNSVTVSGIGTTYAQPDMAQIYINISHTAPTTSEAKRKVEQSMQQVLEVLQAQQVESKDMKTLALHYEVEYEYRNGRAIRIGQQARQTIAVTVKNLIDAPERFDSILDNIVSIDKVEVQNIHFDIEKKTDLFKQSRELAYQKAFDKAKQYAELSGRKLGSVLTISENVSQDVASSSNLKMQNNMAIAEAAYDAMDGGLVPTGEQGVTSEISITFALD